MIRPSSSFSQVALAVLVASCAAGSKGGRSGGDGGTRGEDAPTYDARGADQGAGPGDAGDNDATGALDGPGADRVLSADAGREDAGAAPRLSTVSGNPDGKGAFTFTVASAWWIQHPDPRTAGGPPAQTVVFLFSKPVPCDKLNVTGWDETNEPGDTQNVEIKMAWSGATPPVPPPAATFPAVPLSPGTVPPAGKAWVFYQVTPHQPPGTPSEITARSGAVTLDELKPNTSVSGTFTATYSSGGMLTGAFDAAYCPTGIEP
jgi:hypothetical protein